jgi:hypothetical protein
MLHKQTTMAKKGLALIGREFTAPAANAGEVKGNTTFRMPFSNLFPQGSLAYKGEKTIENRRGVAYQLLKVNFHVRNVVVLSELQTATDFSGPPRADIAVVLRPPGAVDNRASDVSGIAENVNKAEFRSESLRQFRQNSEISGSLINLSGLVVFGGVSVEQPSRHAANCIVRVVSGLNGLDTRKRCL